MIRIVLVDDQELVRTGLRTLAEHDGDIEVVAEAANGSAGVDAVRQHRPDVVLMDIRMPRMDGIAATRTIVADPTLADVRVVVLTTFDEDENVQAAIRAGSAGYLLKDIAPAELRGAIRTVAAGDALLSPAITRKVMDTLAAHSITSTRPALLATLTSRERDVLSRLGLGESNGEIGASLHISPATARTYVSRLLTKLSARDRSQLVILSYESGLIKPGGKRRGLLVTQRGRWESRLGPRRTVAGASRSPAGSGELFLDHRGGSVDADDAKRARSGVGESVPHTGLNHCAVSGAGDECLRPDTDGRFTFEHGPRLGVGMTVQRRPLTGVVGDQEE